MKIALFCGIIAAVLGSVLTLDGEEYTFNTWYSLSNKVYDVKGTTLVHLNDTWAFCYGGLPKAGEKQTALVTFDIFFLILGCDWNDVTDAAHAAGYEMVIGNFPPELYAQVYGVFIPIP